MEGSASDEEESKEEFKEQPLKFDPTQVHESELKTEDDLTDELILYYFSVFKDEALANKKQPDVESLGEVLYSFLNEIQE
jgi:hypothetical protein